MHASKMLQAGVGLVGSALGGGPALSRNFHAALEASVAEFFKDNHAINCMCHSTENMYRCEKARRGKCVRERRSSSMRVASILLRQVILSIFAFEGLILTLFCFTSVPGGSQYPRNLVMHALKINFS